MKVYAIGYQEQDTKMRYFLYTCKFLSVKSASRKKQVEMIKEML